MRNALRNMASILTLLVISSFGLMGHASAMPSSMHGMSGGHSHKMPASTRCATLCMSTVFSEEQTANPYFEEEDEPVTPYYIHERAFQLSDLSTGKLPNDYATKPPPKVPIYILYGVFRS